MRNIDFNRAFPETPAGFHQRVEKTLLTLEEEPVKKLTLRAIIMVAAITLLLASIAYAAFDFNQNWYLNSRFDAWKRYEPDRYEAIIKHLQTDIAQSASGPASELVTVKIMDAAYAPEHNTLTLSLTAEVKDKAKYELHGANSMDVDGATVGTIDPDDEESRLNHWLWTPKGHGLPQDVMQDPQKQLLLVNTLLTFRAGKVEQRWDMADEFIEQMGDPVMSFYKVDTTRLLPAIQQKAQEDDHLDLVLPFTVQTFSDDSYGEAIQGEVSFSIKTK